MSKPAHDQPVLPLLLAPCPLPEAVAQVLASWAIAVDGGAMSPQSLDKWRLLLGRLQKFATATAVRFVHEIDADVAQRFVLAKSKNRRGEVAAVSVDTSHARRAGLRAFFRAAIDLGLTLDDPTARIALPPREQSVRRPVTDEEVDLLRLHALRERPTFHAPVIALLLAGGHTAELGFVTIEDIDLAAGLAWSRGTAKYTPRHLSLDSWAAKVLTRQLNLSCPRFPGRGWHL